MKCDIFSPTLVTAAGQAVAVHQWPRRDFFIANPSEQERNLQQVRLLREGQESDLQIYRRPQVSHIFPSAHNKSDDQEKKSYCPNNKTTNTPPPPPPKRFWQPLHSNQNNSPNLRDIIWISEWKHRLLRTFGLFSCKGSKLYSQVCRKKFCLAWCRHLSTPLTQLLVPVGSAWFGLQKCEEWLPLEKTSSHLPSSGNWNRYE